MTKQLITISDNAAKRIKEILSNAESGVKGVRISVKSGGCAGMEYEMTYLKETIPNDEVVKDNNVEVFIDPKAIMYLLGTKMDYKEDKFLSSFVFNNPNETERCGCGESFKI
jgi:iron-sulfur cluster assembly protein